MIYKQILNILILTAFFSLNAFGQLLDLPDIEKSILFDESVREYNDTIPRDKFRINGRLQVKYNQEGDETIRYEYYERGTLKSKSKIIHQIGIDSIAFYNEISKKPEIAIRKRLYDNPNGEYVEYFDNFEKNNIKNKGNCINGNKVGEWIHYDKYRNKIVVNFNKNGEFEGKYLEYHFNEKDSTYTKKVEGTYGYKEHQTKIKYFDEELKKKVIKTINNKLTRRVGVWKFYAKNGTLLEETEYKWLAK